MQAAAIDSDQNKIYISNHKGSMAILELNDVNEKAEWKIINDSMKIGKGSQGIMINNEFHAIGGLYWVDNKSIHAVYDDNERKYLTVCVASVHSRK